MANQEVKFLHGTGLIEKAKTVSMAVDTFYVSTDASVMYAGGKPYYGAPTIAYTNNQIKLYGDSAKTVELGSVDLSLHSMVEDAKYVESGVSSVTFNDDVTVELTEDEQKNLPGICFLLHVESTESGDTHSVVILPMKDVLKVAQTEIDKIEEGVGLNADGSFTAPTGTTYVTDATTVKEALEKLDKAIEEATGDVKVTSPNETIAVDESGRKIDVNHDKVTIKQSTGNTYENGDTIADNDLYAADAIIEQGFTVLGGNVGQLTSGTKISGGTTVIELLKQMLVKEADCTAVPPTCTLSISPTTSPVEVGTVVSETLSSTYVDGKFTGSTADYGRAYSVDAGCEQGTVTYKRGTTTVSSPDSYTLPYGTTTWSCTSTYGASSVTPEKNNGAASSKSIASGTTTASTASIKAYYKWYLGETTADSVANIVLSGEGANVSNVTTGWTSAATEITMSSAWVSTGKSIFVLVYGTLTGFADDMTGASLIPNFVTDDKTIAIGGSSTETYKGYLWVITNGAIIKGKNIKMTKK